MNLAFKNKSLISAFTLGLLLTAPAAWAPQAMAQSTTSAANKPFVLALSTGFQRIVTLPAVPARVAIGDPTIASVSVLKPTGKGNAGAGVLVTGLKTGSTSLLIWDKGSSMARVITVSVTGKGAQTISDIKDLSLSTDNQVLKLSGSTPDVAAYEQARESLSKSSGKEGEGSDLIDTATLQVPGAVQVDVKVVEYSKTEMQKLGINLFRNGAAGFDGSNIIQNAFTITATSTRNDLNLVLNILQSDGYARILAEPSLVAQSGQEASFLAGGEVPIPVPAGNGTVGIQYKKFGIGLTFKPTILSNQTIALNVSPEVSDLDFSRGTSIQGIVVPAILTRRASTTVELGENQTFVIGGLVSRNIVANASKVPWLADIPILGAFFKNNSYNREDKELLIMVTPHFVKPRDSKASKLPLPGENIGAHPRSVWGQLFLPSKNEPVPGFSN